MGKKNLHEAFQEAAARQKAALMRVEDEPPAPEPEAREGAQRRRLPRGASVLDAQEPREVPAGVLAFREPIVLAALVLAFALGTFFGGRAGGKVEAGPAVLAGNAGLARDSAEWIGDSPLLSAETPELQVATPGQVAAALADPENRYTIQTVSYANDEKNMEWAKDTVSWMEQQGLPVAPPQVIGDFIAVLVGVGQTGAELEGLLSEVQAMPDQSQRPEAFAGARIMKIDKLLAR